MKKMTRIIAAALLAMCLTVGAVGCQKSDDKGGDNGTSAAEAQNGFVGAWKSEIDEDALNETSYTEEEKNQTRMMVTAMTLTLTIKDGGAATVEVMGQTIDTTWTADGDVITVAEAKMDSSGMAAVEKMILKLDGDKLVPTEEMLKENPGSGFLRFAKA